MIKGKSIIGRNWYKVSLEWLPYQYDPIRLYDACTLKKIQPSILNKSKELSVFPIISLIDWNLKYRVALILNNFKALIRKDSSDLVNFVTSLVSSYFHSTFWWVILVYFRLGYVTKPTRSGSSILGLKLGL